MNTCSSWEETRGFEEPSVNQSLWEAHYDDLWILFSPGGNGRASTGAPQGPEQKREGNGELKERPAC